MAECVAALPSEKVRIADHPVQCYRADQNSRSEPFIRTIIDQMKTANITVVFVPGTDKNPKDRNENVFYELGVAHAMGLPTIIYAKDYKRMPADLRHLNIIIDKNRLTDSVKEVLSKDEYHPVFVA
jgi:nucleoside 2-deoxyribosyltransferase